MSGVIITQGIDVQQLLEQMRSIVREEIKQANESQPTEEKLLSPGEACKVFQPNISKSTLFFWEKAGKVQCHRIGGRVYYKRSEIIASLATLKKYKSAS